LEQKLQAAIESNSESDESESKDQVNEIDLQKLQQE
jgi:hypothetical protein